MQLAEAVTAFYFDHASTLSPIKQFHFASRIAAWTGDERAFHMLMQSRDFIVSQNTSSFANLFTDLIAVPVSSDVDIPAYTLRAPYFEKYTPLYGLELALFRLRHLEAVYGIDARSDFAAAVNTSTLLDLESRLLADIDAVKVLSTYAVNYTYMLHRVLLKEPKDGIDPSYFHDLGATYDTNDKEQLRLLIYLYTHCIVAESNLYTQHLPENLMAVYKQMLATLEVLIESNYTDISLDTKLEFLVCCRICQYDTPLFGKVHTECETSISPEGSFVVDTHNAFTGIEAKRTFSGSEHRNVLFIMSTTPYRPRSTQTSAASRLRQ